ncbi:YqeG family HAD IIIA-type phosphatase [Thermoanaerobacterium sp. RBIITD]|uniref:YqeG family HAD IIIA-type phosphatase n=1 Tax=Thermoanaerobacterium sp. RBIITD TaxID=1550240 RepID=UPI000BB8439F|nr:YqeG family HAD IIIA-type phosphatase [Thermoanaerobacterium sp. RBIITD]SNX55336.1 hypothetical protein SAMN05660242_3159 [Thermoanaerobacterium sp. RBIITD]
MYQKLIPDMYVKTIYDIDFEKLKEKGIHCLVVDIDNTLVPQKVRYADRNVIRLFKYLKSKDFRVCLISNNTNKRVDEFREKIEVPGIAWAIKPRRGAFNKALKILDAKPEETAIIGDQIFTDILGGHRAGLYTILVTPISKEEFGWTKLMRRLERQVLKRL